MSVFSAEAFLNQTSTDALATKIDPIPDGEYIAETKELDSSSIMIKQRDNGSVYAIANLVWVLTAKGDGEGLDDIRATLNRPEGDLTVRQSLFIDLSPEGHILSGPNTNVQLGKLREALGQNEPGKAWNFGMLGSQGPCRIMVGQRPDKNDPEVIYADVKRVAPMG